MKPAHLLIAGLTICLFGPVDIVSAQTGGHADTDASMAAGLRELQDREAIRAVLIAYGRHFDARDFEAYSDLFAADGIWIGSGRDTEYVGPDAILGMARQGFPPTVLPGSFHVMTSISVELTGPDSARAWSRWMFMTRNEEGNPVPSRAGHYEDELIRVDGQWKFQRRQVFAE